MSGRHTRQTTGAWAAPLPAKSWWVVLVRLVGQAALLVAVLVTPWLFGGVHAETQALLIALVGVASVSAWLSVWLSAERQSAVPGLWIVLLLALGLAGLQLVPLPSALHAILSPRSLDLWSTAGIDSDFPDSAGVAASRAAAARFPLSLYPASTRYDLALLVLAVAAVVAASELFSSATAAFTLCAALGANGAGQALFGTIQQMTWNGLLYWQYTLPQGGTPFAAYVNKNSAAGYLNLCLGGALALTLGCLLRHGPAVAVEPGGVPRGARRSRRPLAGVSQLVRLLETPNLAALTLSAFVILGLAGALSRGAWVGFAAGVILCLSGLHAARRLDWRLGMLVASLVAGLYLVAWVGREAIFQERLLRLMDSEQTLTDGRLPHWAVGLRTGADFWRCGTGLGTYRYAYLLNSADFGHTWFYHAENQYLEALVDGGVAGLALLTAAILLTVAASWRLLLQPVQSFEFAVGVGGLYIVGAQAVHGCFDFGLYLPANMITMATVCGMLAGSAARAQTLRPLAPARHLSRMAVRSTFCKWLAPVKMAIMAACIAGLPLAWQQIDIHAAVQAAMRTVHEMTLATDRLPPDLDVRGARSRLEKAARLDPSQAEVHRVLAALWVVQLRSEAQQFLELGTYEATRWEQTRLTDLHGFAHSQIRRGRLAPVQTFLRHSPARASLPRAMHHLAAARRACPILADVHLAIGQLYPLATGESDDRVFLERARRLTAANPDMQFLIGVLELQAGRDDLAHTTWRQSLAVSNKHLEAMMQIANDRGTTPAELLDLLPPQPALLLEVARDYYADQPAYRDALLEAASRHLNEVNALGGQRASLEAQAAALRGEMDQAVRHYHTALEREPEQAAWRYELAKLYWARGDRKSARHHAQICALMQPQNEAYSELLREIVRSELLGRESLPP